MTEEINFSYEGGLYGELIRNRTFKANPTNAVFWNAVGDAAISLDTNQPLNRRLNVSLKLDASKASKTSPAGIANGGYLGNSRQTKHDVSRLVLCARQKVFRAADIFLWRAPTAKRFCQRGHFKNFRQMEKI